MKKVKNVEINLDLEGHGIVNYDSNDQKWLHKGTKLFSRHENVMYAKKSFYTVKDEDGNEKMDYKIKISDDCLLNNVYRYDKISLVPNVVHHNALLYAHIASTISLLTGYLHPSSNETIRRKGSLKLASAKQTCNAKSVLELFSRSGQKFQNDGSSEKSDTSLFFKETIGDVNYTVDGNIDLMSLQYVPCDSIFDRYQFNPDYFNLYRGFMAKKMPNFNSELNYYMLKNSSIKIPEYGIMLSNENVVFMVKEGLKRLLNIHIEKKGSYAKTSSLKIKLVTNPLGEDEWIEIKNEDDINELDFEMYEFYEVFDLEEGKSFRDEFTAKIKEEEERIKAEKKEKTAQKKKYKENLKENNNE